MTTPKAEPPMSYQAIIAFVREAPNGLPEKEAMDRIETIIEYTWKTCEKAQEARIARMREALEMAYELQQNGMINFKKYGFKTDADIGDFMLKALKAELESSK